VAGNQWFSFCGSKILFATDEHGFARMRQVEVINDRWDSPDLRCLRYLLLKKKSEQKEAKPSTRQRRYGGGAKTKG